MADINDLKDICISSGTLRAEDLLLRFMGILKDYAPEKFNEFIKGYPELDGWEDFLEADWRIISDDTKADACDALFGLLNDIAPEGTMFSSTEGDGSDFGFWTVKEKKEESKDITTLTDLKKFILSKNDNSVVFGVNSTGDLYFVDSVNGKEVPANADSLAVAEDDSDEHGKRIGNQGTGYFVVWKNGKRPTYMTAQQIYDELLKIARSWSIKEKFLDDDEGEKALKQMAKDGKSTGEVAADIRYDVATALDVAADKAEDLMTKFGLDNIYVLRAKGLSPKAIAKKILKACESKAEAALRPWRTDFEKDLQKRIDDVKGTKYDTKDFTADGWEFVTGDVYDDGSEYGSNGKDVAVAFFKREHDGQYYRMWLAFDPDTKEITGGKWWIESDESKDERHDSADYLQEVWDALVSVWDKEKFDMAKGYDDEYECEAITIASKDNEGVRAKIYVDDHEGKHPVGFDVIYRYPGDKGVGDLGYYEFQSTDFDETAPEIFAYFDELKGKVSEAKGDNWVAYYFCEDPQGLEWAVLPHAINGIGNASCVNSRGGNDSIAIEYVLDECTPIEDVKGSDIYGKVKDFEDRNIMALTRDEAERIAIADDRLEMLRSVVAGKDESCKREATGVAAIYGDGDVSTHENSADGFYVDEHDPMGFAVLNNDTATMKELFSGKAVAPEKPWTYAGWHEDTDAPENKDGSYPYVYDWEREYDLNFVNDWKRVVGDKDNEEALELLLKYAPDFIPSAMDFWNAFHAGYSKGLLRKLFDNIFAVVDKDDPNNNYLGYEDYTYDEVAKFLDGKDEAADSRRVDDYANMRFFDPEEFVKYVRKAYGKDGGYVSIDSVVPVSVLNKANRMAQKNGYSKLESKKSESLTLKQKELKDMARYGEAEDITTISDAEAKELKKKGIETVGVSRGTYGMNGALLRDREGNKYVITARSSNLFYFV